MTILSENFYGRMDEPVFHTKESKAETCVAILCKRHHLEIIAVSKQLPGGRGTRRYAEIRFFFLS